MRVEITQLPEALAARVKQQFPTATALSSDFEFAYCEQLFVGDRFGGTAQMGTNPTSEKLVADLREWAGQ